MTVNWLLPVLYTSCQHSVLWLWYFRSFKLHFDSIATSAMTIVACRDVPPAVSLTVAKPRNKTGRSDSDWYSRRSAEVQTSLDVDHLQVCAHHNQYRFGRSTTCDK